MNNFAYDPSKTNVIFDGVKITGVVHGVFYRRVMKGVHELSVQITSPLLSRFGVGNTGMMVLDVHVGGEKNMSFVAGVVRLTEIHLDELGNEVPRVRVIFENI